MPDQKIVFANPAIYILSCIRHFISDIALKTEKNACFVTLQLCKFLQRKNARSVHNQF